MIVLRAKDDQTPIDPFTINAIECTFDELSEVLVKVQRGELAAPQPQWGRKGRGSLWELLFDPTAWWCATGNCDGNLPLLAPNHLTTGAPAHGWKLRTALQAVLVMAVLGLIAHYLGVALHIVAKIWAMASAVALALATLTGYGSGIAGAVYGGCVSLLVAVLWDAYWHPAPQSNWTGVNSMAQLVATAYGVAWWRFQLGSFCRAPLAPGLWADLRKGLRLGFIAALVFILYAVFIHSVPWLHTLFRPYGQASAFSQGVRVFVGLGITAYLLKSGMVASITILNRARDGLKGIIPVSMIIGAVFLIFYLVRFTRGEATTRYVAGFVSEGASISAIVTIAYLMPYARHGPHSPADRTTILGLGSVLGLLAGVVLTFFLAPNLERQAWHVVAMTPVFLLLAWVPLPLIHLRDGRRLWVKT